MKDNLIEVRRWAHEKIQDGSEPPWTKNQYTTLVETIDAILAGMNATTTENSPRLDQHQGTHLRLVGARCLPATAQPHPAELPVQMPT